jgi:hypothetical protein
MQKLLIATALIVVSTLLVPAQSRIPVMLLDGESGGPYHDWPRVTVALKKMLDETGLFATTVVTAPPAGATTPASRPSSRNIASSS